MIRHLVVRCEGGQDIAVVACEFDFSRDMVRIAELVRPEDGGLTQRVNKVVFEISEYPELDALYDLFKWEWDMDAVEDLVIGYLNRQSDARVRLREEWAAELGQVS